MSEINVLNINTPRYPQDISITDTPPAFVNKYFNKDKHPEALKLIAELKKYINESPNKSFDNVNGICAKLYPGEVVLQDEIKYYNTIHSTFDRLRKLSNLPLDEQRKIFKHDIDMSFFFFSSIFSINDENLGQHNTILRHVSQEHSLTPIEVNELNVSNCDMKVRAILINFNKSDFTNASMNQSEFRLCTFNESQLSHIKMNGSTYCQCTFRNSTLTHAEFRNSLIGSTDFLDSKLPYADFSSSTIKSYLAFNNSDLTFASFAHSVIKDCYLFLINSILYNTSFTDFIIGDDDIILTSVHGETFSNLSMDNNAFSIKK